MTQTIKTIPAIALSTVLLVMVFFCYSATAAESETYKQPHHLTSTAGGKIERPLATSNPSHPFYPPPSSWGPCACGRSFASADRALATRLDAARRDST